MTDSQSRNVTLPSVAVDASQLANCIERFRAARPHVHCITNTVAQHFTANVILAAGGTPSMTVAVAEIADFVRMADALLINLGTLDAERREAISIAVDTADKLNKPWVLDPVFVQASSLRLDLAKHLLTRKPTVLRSNAAEGKALFERELSSDTISDLAQNANTVIAMTGKTDVIANANSQALVSNGNPLMDRITAMGCALTALVAGMQSVENDSQLAAVAAIAMFGVAGEQAGARAEGPGTFVPHFLDALANLSAHEIEQAVRIK